MSGAGAPLLRLERVTKSYPGPAGEIRVLDRVDLAIARGEMVSLVGVSGSGKSTLLTLIAGLLRPEDGRILLDGRDITVLDDVARAQARAERIGVVLQRGNLIPFLTARENVELAVGLAGGGRAAARRAVETLRELGLGGRLDRSPRQLSGGEAQRASLAVALANDPELLLADEATGELDAASAERVMDVMSDAWRQRGLAVLFVTHSAELAARAQRRLHLVDGVVLAG